MKRNFLCSILLPFGLAAIGVACFTGCLDQNRRGDASRISETELKQLEGEVDDVVTAYFKEKYDVQTAVTYQVIAGGVFLGPDPSAEPYYLVMATIPDSGADQAYYVNVYGRKVDGVDALYVKSEAYYGQVIGERMEKWLDAYVRRTDLETYDVSFFSSATNQFPGECDADASAEEILQSMSSIEDTKERPAFTLYVNIPQSEYQKHSDIANEFSELKKHVSEIGGRMHVSLNVYADQDYVRMRNHEDSDFAQLEEVEIADQY